MSEFTGYYDRDGIPIHVGDLIREEHYKHRRGRRQMWVYYRVTKCEKHYVVQSWKELDAEAWECFLSACELDVAEVIAESGLERDEHGDIVTFNERKRKCPE